MFSQFGPLELVLVLVILLVIFGPKRLPSLGRHLGSGMREFKDSLMGDRDRDVAGEDAEPPALTPAPAQEAPAPAPDPAPADRVSDRRG